MKLALVGVGTFGSSWYRLLKEHYLWIDVVVVEEDRDKAAQLIDAADPLYALLREAIEQEHPDMVLNATPPHVHTAINHLAFDHRLPVLCEKPIAADYREAVEIVARATQEGIPFMIAENYRHFPIMRRLKEVLATGVIGEVATIHIRFFRAFHSDKPYLLAMQNPLLVDVTVHHLDVVRYLTGSEGKRMFARPYNPQGSWYRGNAAVDLLLEMHNGVHVNYTGNLASHGPETEWHGEWRIEGTRGMLLATDSLCRVQEGHEHHLGTFATWALRGTLDEFLACLKEQREPETSGRDYLKTQRLVYHAEQSSRLQRTVEIECAE